MNSSNPKYLEVPSFCSLDVFTRILSNLILIEKLFKWAVTVMVQTAQWLVWAPSSRCSWQNWCPRCPPPCSTAYAVSNPTMRTCWTRSRATNSYQTSPQRNNDFLWGKQELYFTLTRPSNAWRTYLCCQSFCRNESRRLLCRLQCLIKPSQELNWSIQLTSDQLTSRIEGIYRMIPITCLTFILFSSYYCATLWSRSRSKKTE